MKNARYVIGIDGGGTKTAALITDLQGSILAEHVAGPSNFQIIGVEKAAETLFGLIEECCSSVNAEPKNIVSMTIGLAGAGRLGDQQRMAAALKDYAASKHVRLKHIVVESDARIALEGAFKGAPGIILIAGTGSIAFAKDSKGTVHRVGGWGRIIGDEGSGYSIGRNGLAAVAHELDGRGEKTHLTRLVKEKFHLTTQPEIISALYKNNFDVASVAPLVLVAAEKNDQVCTLIVEQAAAELGDHVRVMAALLSSQRRKTIQRKIPLSFIGGLVANDTLLKKVLTSIIERRFPQITITAPQTPPVFGAVVMSLPLHS